MTDNSFDPAKYWETRLRDKFDLGGVGSIDLSIAYNEWLYRLRKRYFRKYVAPRVEAEGIRSVIDIGSGTGFYIERWLESGVSSIIGLDITDASVSRLSTQYPGLRFIRDDIGESKLTLPSADAVSAFDVLFHIVDDLRFEHALTRIANMVKPGGLFVYSDVFQRHAEFRSVHQAGRCLDYISAILTRVGFAIEDRRPVFVTMVDPTDVRSEFWRACWLRVGRFAAEGRRTSYLLGATLYAVDALLTDLLREGPSIEVMFCRRSTDG